MLHQDSEHSQHFTSLTSASCLQCFIVSMQPLVIKLREALSLSAASQSHLWAAAPVLFVLGYFTPALV